MTNDIKTVETREARLREALTGLNRALDAFWNDPERPLLGSKCEATSLAVANAQERSRAALAAETWRPIESAPHNEQVLLYCPERGITNHERIELGFASHGRRVGATSSFSRHSWATHWMPLPNPPAKKDLAHD